jgi:hypothetical protein
MNTQYLTTFGLLLLLICSSVCAGENKALVIGISQYTEINSLRYADSDALEFSQILTDLAGYNKSDVSVLLNQEATKKHIVEEINKVVRMSEKHPLDNFILMFAGHGIENTLTARNKNSKGESRETNMFLAPSDASTDENNFYSTGNGKEVSNETFINKAWLARQLSAIQAKSIFIILDSCYSGTKSFGTLFLENEGYSIQSFSAKGSNRGVADVKRKRALKLKNSTDDAQATPVKFSENRKIAYLASSRDDQASAEYEELQHGALSYCIFEYIKRVRREVSKGDKKNISIEDVYANITKLFHTTNIKGASLDEAHQPLLIPIPDFTDMRDMVLISVAGTREKVANSENVKKGVLKITSRDSSASDIEIYIDGIKSDEQINTAMKLSEGRHTVELYANKTGYRYTFTADISAGNPVSKAVKLQGELFVASFWLKDGVKSEGPQLEVSVDGNKVGKSKLHLDNLMAGSHVIEVKFQDVIKSRQIEIRPDSPLRLNYSISKEGAPPPDENKVRNVMF